MNSQNQEFLKKSLLNLGFGEKLNAELDKQISSGAAEFTLSAAHEFNQKNMDYTLHFRAGDQNEMYFFNKYDAVLRGGSDSDKDQAQTFYINKGHGITAKEAFNLIEGRSVQKQLYSQEGEKYTAWIKLDNDDLTDAGNKRIKTFYENYGYDVEKILTGVGIREMNSPDNKENLLRSLQKGNAQQITVSRDGQDIKYFVAANPQFKTVELFNSKMAKIKREELLAPDAKSSKKAARQEQVKEGLPEKKPQRKAAQRV